MNLKVLNKVGKFLLKKSGKFGLKCQRKSPEIMLAVGIVGIGAGVVLACRATLRSQDVMDFAEVRMKQIKAAAAKAKELDITEYNKTAIIKEKIEVMSEVAFELTRLYAVPVLCLTVGVACIIGSHGIMRRRNFALLAAYKSLEVTFKEYRNRVAEEFGEDKEYKIKHGMRDRKTLVTETNEKGKTKTREEITTIGGPNSVSQYARYFNQYNPNHCDGDGTNPFYEDAEGYNQSYISAQQNFANDLLTSRGHVFLNEVYDMLGFKHTPDGAIVGWVTKDKNPNADGFIDFGIHEIYIQDYTAENHCDTIGEEREDFVNGERKTILLDFNVDGTIYDLI